jgi:hypothetical protein
MRKRKTKLILLCLTAAAVIGAAIAGVTRTQAGASPALQWSLDAKNISALNNARTTLANVPTRVGTFGQFQPAAAGVHALGNGAVAWQAHGRICWIGNAAGGCVQALKQPIDWTYGDRDLLGSGEPATVFGLAVDAVARVTVTLRDGTAFSATPDSNFYVVTLPANATPEEVQSVTATMADGSHFNSAAFTRASG